VKRELDDLLEELAQGSEGSACSSPGASHHSGSHDFAWRAGAPSAGAVSGGLERPGLEELEELEAADSEDGDGEDAADLAAQVAHFDALLDKCRGGSALAAAAAGMARVLSREQQAQQQHHCHRAQAQGQEAGPPGQWQQWLLHAGQRATPRHRYHDLAAADSLDAGLDAGPPCAPGQLSASEGGGEEEAEGEDEVLARVDTLRAQLSQLCRDMGRGQEDVQELLAGMRAQQQGGGSG
jgi:hypothetical protein